MKYPPRKGFAYAVALLSVAACATPVEAQTDRALQRRVDRNERQLQRQLNRGDYYSPQTWQQLDPWIRDAGVVPFASTTAPARNAANAVGNAVRQTVDAATRIGDGQFGFRDKDPRSTWFYDYYTVSPTYYVPQGEDRYSSAIRYFDSDQDGLFESQSQYRDSDNDGRYDEYDQLDFYALPKSDNELSQAASSDSRTHSDYLGPEDSRRHRLEGEIAMTKVAQVDGHEHLVVGLKQSDTDALAIDLGDAERLRGKQIEVGTAIVAYGSLQQVGEKKLLVADTVQVANGEPIRIARSFGQSYQGEIVNVKTMQIHDQDFYMAVVDINGERQLVDLGPARSYKVALKPKTKISIQGIPVRASDHRVILAHQVDVGGGVVQIERSRQF